MNSMELKNYESLLDSEGVGLVMAVMLCFLCCTREGESKLRPNKSQWNLAHTVPVKQ